MRRSSVKLSQHEGGPLYVKIYISKGGLVHFAFPLKNNFVSTTLQQLLVGTFERLAPSGPHCALLMQKVEEAKADKLEPFRLAPSGV